MRVLVFQHIECEHPGSLRQFLAADKAQWDAVNLQLGEPIPRLADFDALWVMGGPMDVWDEVEHPWLIAEKAAIRQWVTEMGKPYLGLCLGHQLLADALGGVCELQYPAEIGVLDIELTAAGQRDGLLGNTPTTQKCLQWHSVAVTRVPAGAVVLARSPACPVQAMRIADNAWSMQYHVEIEPDTVANWAEIPAYRDALAATLGPSALARIDADATANMAGFLASAEAIYTNFRAIVERAKS